MIVAIDGPAGAGKSTIARELASRLGWVYLDTGAIFRAITWFFLKKGYPEKRDINSCLKEIDIKIDGQKIYVNSTRVDEEIRTPLVDRYVSDVASIKKVREFAKDIERRIASMHENIVVEGRDTTTVVFKDADLKIFLDASVDERARRRYEQLKEKGIDNIGVEDIKEEILKRDRKDSTRKYAPLSVSEDSVVIDTTSLSVDEVIEKIVAMIKL